jgi:hypothetical protein
MCGFGMMGFFLFYLIEWVMFRMGSETTKQSRKNGEGKMAGRKIIRFLK